MSNEETQGEENPYESPRTKSLAAKKPKINQVFQEPGLTLSLFLMKMIGYSISALPTCLYVLMRMSAMQSRLNTDSIFNFEMNPLLELALVFACFYIVVTPIDIIINYYKRKFLHPLIVGDFAIIGIVKQRYKEVLIKWSDIASYSLEGNQGLLVSTKDGKEYRFLTEKIPEHRLWKLEQFLAHHSENMAR